MYNGTKFFKYVFCIDSEKGSYLDVVKDREQYDLATNRETVRFFKSFGKCYFRHNKTHDVFYTQCGSSYKVYRYYNTLAALIREEGLKLVDLATGANTREKSFYGKAQMIIDKNGINKGLKSYDELVATFEAGERIRLLGYFSQTTTRHQDAYCFPTHSYYKFNSSAQKIDKAFLDKRGSLYFAG